MSDAGEAAAVRRPGKSASAFRTIGEVSADLDLPSHVLRFWESKFPQLKPLKRGGGRRYYRPEDVALLRRIRACLYQDGYTIRGVQKLLGENDGATADPPEEAPRSPPDQSAAPTLFPLAPVDPRPQPATARLRAGQPPRPARSPEPLRAALAEIRDELLAIRALLDELRKPRPPGPREAGPREAGLPEAGLPED